MPTAGWRPRSRTRLQRLAKPWNRRRALEVFRDDTSLSVSPHLWTSITQALDSSEWFVLMASPAAASSEWVNMEVEHWLAGGDGRADRILPVVTGGVWEWAGTGFSDATTAVPPALHGVFTEEPRHLDLSWANQSVDLDLDNARFRQAIAQIAAPMHETTQDELIGDDVRLHRRAVLIRRTATAALAVLFVGCRHCGGDRVPAAEHRRRQRRRSHPPTGDREVTRPKPTTTGNRRSQRGRDDQQGIAEENAAESRSRELAARAEQEVDGDPALAVLLAVQAHGDATLDQATPEAERALRLANASLATAEAVRRPVRIETDLTEIAASPDGTMIAATQTPTRLGIRNHRLGRRHRRADRRGYRESAGRHVGSSLPSVGAVPARVGSVGHPCWSTWSKSVFTNSRAVSAKPTSSATIGSSPSARSEGFGGQTVVRIYSVATPDDPPDEFPFFPTATFQPAGEFDELRALPSGTIVLTDQADNTYSWVPGQAEPTLLEGVVAESMSWETMPTVDSIVVSGPTLEPDVSPQFQMLEYDLG